MAIIQRCTDTRSKTWKDYGGRGISVSQEWMNDFSAFLRDMGPRPSPKHSIDRRNNDGNYEAQNCRWATLDEQSINKRSTRTLTFNGVTKCLRDWARSLNLKPSTLRYRLKKWSLEDALTTQLKGN